AQPTRRLVVRRGFDEDRSSVVELDDPSLSRRVAALRASPRDRTRAHDLLDPLVGRARHSPTVRGVCAGALVPEIVAVWPSALDGGHAHGSFGHQYWRIGAWTPPPSREPPSRWLQGHKWWPPM